jgi:rhodanese-related sulfurtransferase
MRPLFAPSLECTRIPVIQQLIEFASKHWEPWAAAVLAFVGIWFELRTRQEDMASVSPHELVRLVNQNALVIDLRAPDLYKAGHVSGARQMSGEQILKAADTLKKYKGKTVVVYDDTGSLGNSAVRQLIAQGFTKALNLRGGLAAWRAENLPLMRG